MAHYPVEGVPLRAAQLVTVNLVGPCVVVWCNWLGDSRSLLLPLVLPSCTSIGCGKIIINLMYMVFYPPSCHAVIVTGAMLITWWNLCLENNCFIIMFGCEVFSVEFFERWLADKNVIGHCARGVETDTSATTLLKSPLHGR